MSTGIILNAQGERVTLCGAAPPPDIDEDWISHEDWISPNPPCARKEAGLAIRHFYYVRDKDTLSYIVNYKGEGQVLPLNKGAIDFTIAEAKLVAKGLIELLERIGYKRSSFLSE
ncbi:MAG: hypothetical protein GY833_10730 [Aestuariibacter sp.]|nr:hypothetical protein [Aestuariibacter sp.]